MCAAVSPLRFCPTTSGAVVDETGFQLHSAAKGAWKGALVENLSVLPGGTGCYAIRILGGLVRLGWLAIGGSIDALGTDGHGFGFGGTGKKSHAGKFGDFGEAFGAGDVLGCLIYRSEGCLRIEYSKNGHALGAAFDFAHHEVPEAVVEMPLVAVVCGRQFKVELVGDFDNMSGLVQPHQRKPAAHMQQQLCDAELNLMIEYYATATCSSFSMAPRKTRGAPGCKPETTMTDPDQQLKDFFYGHRSSETTKTRLAEESAIHCWVKTALNTSEKAAPPNRKFQGSAGILRVTKTFKLPSGPTITTIDSQPADRAGVDNSYLNNLSLWESLPRGHSEIHEGGADGRVLREVVGLRKFGNAEERFGPLAREAGSSRQAALFSLPPIVDDAAKDWKVSLVFLTKENGEMCKVSFFELAGTPYFVIGSKNVVVVASAVNQEQTNTDLASYVEGRYAFALEMAEAFSHQFFECLNEEQRCELIRFICDNGATLCGESISPRHQHIQSYCTDSVGGGIRTEIRFFAVTSPKDFSAAGLTFLDPTQCRNQLRHLGLHVVETCEEAPANDVATVQALEEKHLLLPNREGAVVYVVVRSPHEPSVARTALIYKWKNSWYVTVRALREKFCARSSEARIRNRIQMLHVHHPDEGTIVEDFLGFYRWVLLLLPSVNFEDMLRSSWVSLKSAYDVFVKGSGGWQKALPLPLEAALGSTWLKIFPSCLSLLEARLDRSRWVSVLIQHRQVLHQILDEEASQSDSTDSYASVERIMGAFLQRCTRPDASTKELSTEAEPVDLTVVLVRGLQGSGKSSLCRALSTLLGGQWVNQDEIAATLGGRRRGGAARERFLQSIEVAASQSAVRYLFVDKIHTMRQHRDDVRAAVARGSRKRGGTAGRTAIALLNVAHPEDEEGQHTYALPVCTARINARGLGHLSFLPQASNVEDVLATAGQQAEVLGDDEKCKYDLCTDLDLLMKPADLLLSALEQLHAAQLLAPEHGSMTFGPEALLTATETAKVHETGLRANWRTLYWCVNASWTDILWAADQDADPGRRTLREALAKVLSTNVVDGAVSLQPVENPHVTLLWLGGEEPGEETKHLHQQLDEKEGELVRIAVLAVCHDPSLGLVALRVALESVSENGAPPPCQNMQPHITVAKRPEIAAVMSNNMLHRLAAGDATIEEVTLPAPVHITGSVCRRLAGDCIAAVAAGIGLPEVGNPICKLGLATTGEAVDVWATHDARVRWRRVRRTLDKLFCTVTEPLLHCRGWPPALRGKQWFTFHESLLSCSSLEALHTLELSGMLQTLHIGALYAQVPDLLMHDKENMQEILEKRLAGQGADALVTAFKIWQASFGSEALESVAEGCAPPLPKFYVQCKSVGPQHLTTIFRQALAATIAKLAGWEPVIKDPDITLAANFTDDWLLLGIVVPREHRKPPGGPGRKDGKQRLEDPPDKGEALARTTQAKATTSVFNDLLSGLESSHIDQNSSGGDGVSEVNLDGSTLEGGGQLLRNAFAYAAVLGRTMRVFNIRGGRREPGMRPSHVAAVRALQQLSHLKLRGVAVQSTEATVAPDIPGVFESDTTQDIPPTADAGTGGSTMLMLQTLLPVMLAKSAASGGAKVTMNLCGGTNVAPLHCNGPCSLTAPQVDYAQLVLLPMLRRLLGFSLDLALRQRGFLNGGGEVEVNAVSPSWPWPSFELISLGRPVRVRGVAYRSAGVPAHVLDRMIEGQMKKKRAGAAVVIAEHLPEATVEWDLQEVESVNGADAVGIVIAIENSTGCILAGDSMGRKGTPAEKVGEEAARAALASLRTGSCVDEHLEDQLVIFMALAAGISRMRIGKRSPTLHTQTALWVAKNIGANVRMEEDADGHIIVVEGIGSSCKLGAQVNRTE